jgi:hypothetical protein
MKKYLAIIGLSVLLTACSSDDLDRTIFVPDENDHSLPAYTEWGYNSFGAIYERQYFVATNSWVPCKIVQQNGVITFNLIGNFSTRGIDYYESNKKAILAITFPYANLLTNYTDLITLNNYVVDLTDANCTVQWQVEDEPTRTITVRQGSGSELNFKRTQLLRVDGVTDRVILSGTFEIHFLNGIMPESFTEGRFDLGINTKDFASL